MNKTKKNISQNNEPEWLLKFRKENWELFKSLEMPKDDEWKYTDLSCIDVNNIQPSSSFNVNTKNCEESNDLNLIKEYLSLARNKLEALNNAIFSGVKIIFAKKDAKIDMEFSRRNFTKVFVFVEDNAEINISVNSSGFSIIQTYLLVEGHVTLNVFDSSEKDAIIVDEIFADIKKDAKLDCNFALFGGSMNRFKIESNIGLNAENKIKGIFLGKGRQHFNIATSAMHSEASVNDILVKGALKDFATSSHFGSIVIDNKAQKTDSFLAGHVLLLSEDAKTNSIPSLRINANDIKAKHGVTITQLDEDQMFYLLSRGLNRKEAELLLMQAFLNDVKINNPKIQKIIEENF